MLLRTVCFVGLTAMVCARAAGMCAVSPQKVVPTDFAAGDAFGAAVAVDNDIMVVGASSDDDVAGANQGSARVFRWTYNSGWTPMATLLAGDAAAGDLFGTSVDVQGRWIVVGASAADPGGLSSAGAVYVFEYSGTQWVQRAKLLASNRVALDQFGVAVAVGDGRIVVGAPGADPGGRSSQGAAYVFRRQLDGTWVEEAILVSSDGIAADTFGEVVDISGDRIAVGSDNSDVSANADQGAVYTFSRSTGTWVEESKIVDATGAAGDLFGDALSLDRNRIAIGAYADDDAAGTNQGSVSIYNWNSSTSTWVLDVKLLAPDATASDEFGGSVAIIDRVLAVGAPGRDPNALTSAGALYVFRDESTTAFGQVGWALHAEYSAADAAVSDTLGTVVALSEHFVVAGVPGADSGAVSGHGAVHALDLTPLLPVAGRTWSASSFLNNSFAQYGIGAALAANSFYIWSGAPDRGVPGFGTSGAIVRTTLGPRGPIAGKLIDNPVPAASARFGAAVAASTSYLAVGAPGANRVYAFTSSYNPGITEPFDTLTSTIVGPAASNFGGAVDIDSSTVVIGAVLDTSGRGAAHVYLAGAAAGTLQQVITGPDGASHADLGVSVAISGETLVIGDDQINDGATTQEGAAYVYTRSAGVWTLQQKLNLPGANVVSARFGHHVDISGDTLVVASNVNSTTGVVHVFTRSGSVWSNVANITTVTNNATVSLGSGLLAVGCNAGNGYRLFRQVAGTWQQVYGGGSVFSGDFGVPAIQGGTAYFTISSSPDNSSISTVFYDTSVGSCIGRVANVRTGELDTLLSSLTTAPLDSVDASAGVVMDAFASNNSVYGDVSVSFGGPVHLSAGRVFQLRDGNSVSSSGSSDRLSRCWSTFGTIRFDGFIEATCQTTRTGIFGAIDVRAGSNARVFPGDFSRPMELFGLVTVEPAAVLTEEVEQLDNSGAINLIGGVIRLANSFSQPIDLRNTLVGTLTGYGDIVGKVVNEGLWTVTANQQLTGSMSNSGQITVQGGTLSIFGPFTNTGTVIGNCSGCRAPNIGVLAQGDFTLDAASSLLLSPIGSRLTCGADFDAAINDYLRFDLAAATLEMFAITTGAPQTLEAMSQDIGDTQEGLNRAAAGRFPLKVLAISGLSPTVVVDTRDNDNLGQTTCEAIYADTVRIGPGAVLDLSGCAKVYYNTLQNGGTVLNPANLVRIRPPCIADFNGSGSVSVQDIFDFLAAYFNGDGRADVNHSGVVTVQDIFDFLAAYFAGCN